MTTLNFNGGTFSIQRMSDPLLGRRFTIVDGSGTSLLFARRELSAPAKGSAFLWGLGLAFLAGISSLLLLGTQGIGASVAGFLALIVMAAPFAWHEFKRPLEFYRDSAFSQSVLNVRRIRKWPIQRKDKWIVENANDQAFAIIERSAFRWIVKRPDNAAWFEINPLEVRSLFPPLQLSARTSMSKQVIATIHWTWSKQVELNILEPSTTDSEKLVFIAVATLYEELHQRLPASPMQQI